MIVSDIVDQLLEGKGLSDLIKNSSENNIVGKKIASCICPNCQENDSMIVSSIIEEDQNFYTILAKCQKCGEQAELEIVMKDEETPEVTESTVYIKGKIFTPINEGLMTGNYIKFNNGSKGFISTNEKGENLIVFDEPEGDSKPLNSRLTFKVISFRNGLAKLVSMVNDNFNNDKAGTIYFVKKEDLNSLAKVSSPRANGVMSTKYA